MLKIELPSGIYKNGTVVNRGRLMKFFLDDTDVFHC